MAEVRYRWRMGHEPPKTPLVTVDVIIETAGGIVLVRRRNPPAGWALPGGFVDPGERIATRRAARPGRRRGWTSS